MQDIFDNELPAIAVRGIIPLPNNEFRIEVGRDISIKAMEIAEKKFDSNILLLIQKNPLDIDVNIDSIEEIGVLANISIKLKLPNNSFKVKFKVLDRVKLISFTQEKPYLMAQYVKVNTIIKSDTEELALVRQVVQAVVDKQNAIVVNQEEVSKIVQSGVTSDVISDVIAFNLKSNQNKYKYLKTLELEKRLEFILEDIQTEKQIVELENKINAEVKKSIDESQKEYYLREKMKAIQTELGDKAKQDEEIEKLRKAIEDAKMPESMYKKAMQELSRYQSTNSQMAESSTIRNYLDFITSLPWDNHSKDIDDLNKVAEVLNKNHYGLDKVKDRIIEYLAVKTMTKKTPRTILCFAGPPGVGKTSLGKSIADALGRQFVKSSLGGVSDEAEIRGHRRTYIGALPGRILKGLKDAKTSNPVFLLDEIDKMASNYRGDPASAMLEVLDPEQNSQFSDNYLEEPYDLSQVLFITTANDLSNIPAPLRDRMEIIELSSYTEFEKFNIAKNHLISRELENHGLNSEQLIINDDVLYAIIQNFTREAGVRELDRLIATICRKAVKEILMNKKDQVVVTSDNITAYLGKVKFFNNLNRNQNQVGIVTGLAYTQFGGDTLDIEVTYYPGKGGLVLTGKLGDVMKESAQAALSFVKAHHNDFGINSNIFSENDIHVHVPEGAVPKDGPSAGVTLTTAIVSALTGKSVDSHIGMTGEVTLRGAVLPIGGLKEKAIAAHRSGLTTILIPKENENDIDDIPAEVREHLTIIPVSNVMDVISHTIK